MPFSLHRAGWPFIGLFAVITVLLSLFGWPFGVLGCVLTAWCVYFFRDPARVTPLGAGLVVSPADGRVIAIREVTPDPDLGLGDTPRVRISIFLNVFNVHVNRSPADGTVVRRHYRPGAFVNASLDKASEKNERLALAINLAEGHPMTGQLLGVVQIAGLVARRIVGTAHEGHVLQAGQRIGLIRFGSRADVYLPVGVAPRVVVGQTAIAGETVLADMRVNEAPWRGETRE